MARLGLFDEQRQKWVQFDEDTEVLIAFLSKEDLAALVKKAGKKVKMTGGDAQVITNQLIGEAACLGWRKIGAYDEPGLCDGHGRPIPFSAQSRDALMRKSLKFSNFVNETAIDEGGFTDLDGEAEEEGAAKNA